MGVAIEAVLFDLDDTLLDSDRAWQAGMRTLLHRSPPVDRQAASEAWQRAFEEHWPRYLSGELTFEETRIARIRTWSERLSLFVQPGDELSWFDAYRAGYESGWAAFEDVTPALRELAGLQLGVVTNGDGAQQRAKLGALGLGRAFEVVICSGDVGFAKPDARIFEIAAAGLGLAPSQCLYVGDQCDSDTLGALHAGMRALWLNRKGLPVPDEMVTEIRTLKEISRSLHNSKGLPLP
jgi:putative hydrolase of the HAD superfamily